jgi:hypothetical protein
MTNAEDQPSGYAFTEKDIADVRFHLGRTKSNTGARITATPVAVEGFARLAVAIDDTDLNFTAIVLNIQSSKEQGQPVQYAVLTEPDGVPFGPSARYDSLVEALIFADLNLRRTVEAIQTRNSSKKQAERKAVPAFKDNVIASTVLSPEDVHFTQTYATELGHGCGLRGYANFVESEIGVMSVALGVVHKGETMILGTVVVASNLPGSSCSVRDFRNKPMPGAEYYDSIYAALVTTRPYFTKLAELAARQMRPSLMARLFGR